MVAVAVVVVVVVVVLGVVVVVVVVLLLLLGTRLSAELLGGAHCTEVCLQLRSGRLAVQPAQRSERRRSTAALATA